MSNAISKAIEALLDSPDNEAIRRSIGVDKCGTDNSCKTEGSEVKSSGQSGGSRFLREDGNGGSSWEVTPGSGDADKSLGLDQFAQTKASKLQGVVSETTGNGELVFSDSPILTTPSLGVPKAITLTNATGLSLVSGVKGKLGIAKGGTGATTASGARDSLGVDPKGTDNSDPVTLSESSVGARIVGQELTIDKPNVSNSKGTLPIGNGGTGSQTSQDARKSLGLVIGKDVQAYEAPIPLVVQQLTNSALTPWNLSKSRVAKWSHSDGAKLAKANGSVDGETYELTITLSGTMVKFDDSYIFSGDAPFHTSGVLEMSFKSNPMRAQWVHYTS